MTILARESAVMTRNTDPLLPGLPGDEIARACRLHTQALACCAAGRNAEAGLLAERALEIFERESGPDHPDVANLLFCLVGIREEAGDLAEAERLGRRAVGPEHPHVLTCQEHYKQLSGSPETFQDRSS